MQICPIIYNLYLVGVRLVHHRDKLNLVSFMKQRVKVAMV
jgi:hypothetical protein